MMFPNESLDRYPMVPQAVAYVELVLCCDPGDGTGETGWAMIREAGLSMEQTLEVIREAVGDSKLPRSEEILRQTFHPQFRTYIAGKMGMM